MKRTRRFDWQAWRAAIAERLDRRTIVAALAFVGFLTAFGFFTAFLPLSGPRLLLIVTQNLIVVMVTLLLLAVAMVAAERGVSGWIAYPLAAGVAVITGFELAFALDPYGHLPRITDPRFAPFVLANHLIPVVFAALVYVYQSNAAKSASALRRLQFERMTEAERLASERLHAELATIDHDLVLTAMRLARASPADAEALLAALSTYLRAAQQREASDAESVASALDELRRMCAGHASGPAQQAA